MSSLCDSSCNNHSSQYQHQPYCHYYHSIENILLTNINTIKIICTKLVANRARASRAYHTGAGVWGHNPAVGGNAAEEVSPSFLFVICRHHYYRLGPHVDGCVDIDADIDVDAVVHIDVRV